MRKTVFAAVALAFALGVVSSVEAEQPGDARMPAAQQNALVGQYCAVCHTDASMNGGLSLEHFDAATVDPGLAAMLVSKLRGGALGAAGGVLPDRATQIAFEAALVTEADGANKWTFNKQGATLTASIVAASPAIANLTEGKPDLYRLTIACRADLHQADAQLAWSPGMPQSGQTISVSADNGAPVAYKVQGEETMGNGQAGRSGPGAIALFGADAATLTALPEHQLAVNNLMRGENVVFPFNELDANARRALSACIATTHTAAR